MATAKDDKTRSLLNELFVPQGWSVERAKSPDGAPALRFTQDDGDPERDWVVVVAGKNEDGEYTSEGIMLERGAVACLEHQIQYTPEDDRSIVEERLQFARAVERAGRIVRGSAAAGERKGD